MKYDTIDTKNKIISDKALEEIFSKMNEVLIKYKKIYEEEERKNYTFNELNREYTFKDEGSRLKFDVYFHDGSSISYDNYESFMRAFHERIRDMKTIYSYFYLNYSIVSLNPSRKVTYYNQSISMTIYEKKINLDIDLKEEDPKLDEVYDLIREKILLAPERYDDVIKNRSSIKGTIAFSKGLIPATIISLLLLVVPVLNNVIFHGYVVFPIIALIFAYAIGSIISIGKLEKLYDPIVPDKKRIGHDENYNSVYKDDLQNFFNESEVLIGKNFGNLDNREQIREEYEKSKKNLPIGLVVLLIASIAIIIIGLFI